MRLRPVWIFSALLFLLIGAVSTWVALTIPNDVRAEAILKRARADLRNDKRDASKEKLRSLVRQYPRTDAAATAVDTLFQMTEQDRLDMQKRLEDASRERDRLARRLATVEQKLAAATAPKPASVSPSKPAIKKAPAKKASSKKPTKKTSGRRPRR